MKCQKCGRNGVNFHYSSNINGCITETNLCAECAENSGYDLGSMFNTGSLFSGFFPELTGQGGFMPQMISMPMLGFMPMLSAVAMPQMDVTERECSCGGACRTSEAENPATEVDNDMLKRREIGVIREQMLIAAENEDFEKAAQLRDKIKQLEDGMENGK